MISPKIGAYWNLAFVILTGIAAGSVIFAGVPDYWIGIIKTWAANGAFIVSCVNLVFNLYSSPQAGPFIRQ